MRLLIILILFASTQKCNTSGIVPILVKATSQRWSGGAAGSGSGYYYSIYFLVKDKKNFSIDSLWVHGKRIEAKISDQKTSGDTLIVRANEIYPGVLGNNNAIGPSQSSPPNGLNGEGVLSYNFNGVKKYFVINQFYKLPDSNYP